MVARQELEAVLILVLLRVGGRMNRRHQSICVSVFLPLVLFTSISTSLMADQAKKNFSKATVGRVRMGPPQNGPGAGEPAVALLAGLDGKVLELYDDIALVEIRNAHRSDLVGRGHQNAVAVTLHEDFDKVFLNGRTIDARDASGSPPGEQADPPYVDDRQGTWLVQFIGPVKSEWLEALNAMGIVPVQYVPSHAYIVGARESEVREAANLPFVQWTSQMHRYFKPSIGAVSATFTTASEVTTVELWIELVRSDETPDAVTTLESLSVDGIETEPWSEAELRVQGVFRTDDVAAILAEPLVFGLAERPTVELSDERSVLGVTNIVPSVGPPSPEAGKYKKWLSDLCSACTNLQADGFYVGIADTGLDGGDRAASGTIAGEKASSDLHRDELAKSRIVWGRSFAPTVFTGAQTWSNCVVSCPDTTNSKHDTYGHGTLVAGMAAGDPSPTGGTDSGGYFLGLGVAPSAGLLITKIDPVAITRRANPVWDVTRDARSVASPHAYWQNFSLNQYEAALTTTDCSQFYDGAYTMLSRDFDAAVRDADRLVAGNQQITLTVSAGNIDQQMKKRTHCLGIDRTLALAPATAKNVIALGGGENVQPEGFLCKGALADDYQNLAVNAKHGTSFAGWYKPDLIAVSSSTASLLTSDQRNTGSFCSSSVAEPALPSAYRAATGTSLAAPIGAAAAALASRRFNGNPAAATPALVKAMLIAGAKSMRNGKDRAALRRWNRSDSFFVGDRVFPTTPNGHYYEVETVGSSGVGSATTEPQWPTDGSTAADGFGTSSIVWRDKGLESAGLAIRAFPNEQQGFGRLSLEDVLGDYPARVFVNESQTLAAGSSWSASFFVHDLALPTRVALVWTDAPAMWSGNGQTSLVPPLVNDLDLSVRVGQSGNCVGRYVGNDVGSADVSNYNQPCTGGVRDSRNNVEIVRFFASPDRGDTTFTVKVDFTAGTSTQNFALVVWNAYDSATVTPPPPTPATFTATGTSASQVALSWSASSGATSYELQRSLGPRDAYVTIATPAAVSHNDSGLAAATTYLYRVRARNAAGVSDWSVDPGTTVAFNDPVLTVELTKVKAAHITELRKAVAAIRVNAELPGFEWTDDPLAAGAALVSAIHVSELRIALNEARTALGLPAVAFTDGTLLAGASVVRAVHIQQLRGGL